MNAVNTIDAPVREGLTEPHEVARLAGVSLEAVQLLRSVEFIDLHLESYLAPRLYGYDLHKRHHRYWLRGQLFGHLDLPRIRDATLTGAMWSITTNVARPASNRWDATLRNAANLRRLLNRTDGFEVVRDAAAFTRARLAGNHAAILSIQGGNALEGSELGPLELPDVVRVTLMHLTDSYIGHSSSPFPVGFSQGLTDRGASLVEQLDEAKVFVDLAHIDRPGFWRAVDVHDDTLPLIVTHTGACGAHDHWRNLDDRQIKAIVDTGGVIGIMFERSFLRAPDMKNDGRMVIAHLEHLIEVAGEDAAAIGSDYDGFIRPPPDLADGFVGYFRLVQYMLDAGWSETRIEKILGLNFLRCFARIRPGT